MTREEDLIRAICEDPADDAPRLTYCDWLDEHEQGERAEFIRVQIELSRPETKCQVCIDGRQMSVHGRWVACDHQEHRLQQRERRLLAKIELPSWSSGWEVCIPATERPGSPSLTFSRGFISEIRLPTPAFLRHAGDIFSRHPVTKVVLTDKRPTEDVTGWHYWIEVNGGRRPYELPSKLFANLWWETARQDRNRTAADCQAALSTAAVLHGRSLAGLGPLREAVAA